MKLLLVKLLLRFVNKKLQTIFTMSGVTYEKGSQNFLNILKSLPNLLIM